MLDLEQDLRWQLNGDISLPERSGTSNAEATQWDAIVGVKGRATFGAEGNWYVRFYLDVGTGDSDLGDNTSITSIDFNGPALGLTFRF